MKELSTNYRTLHNKLLDITLKHGLSHLSSCLSTLPILVQIYETKMPGDIVILSNGHAGLAQYVCMEHFENNDAQALLEKHGIHPTRDKNIFCSTGSLGLGLPVAIGAAMADANRQVHCIISDGECCEGSIWESLYFLSKNKINNLHIYVNANGISAYTFIDITRLEQIINAFGIDNVDFWDTSVILKSFDLLATKGIESHYIKLDEQTIQQLRL